MHKIFTAFCLVIFALLFTPQVLAKENSFVTVVNPIRGSDFWENKTQQPADAVKNEIEVLQKNGVVASWLIRFDALNNADILARINLRPNDEKGIFLEITDSLTEAAGVAYPKSESWHFAGSALLTGYTQEERVKIIDAAFNRFKEKFGYFPKSVGAWWIDSYSLSYMQKNYGITAALIVADQYSTDGYQVWGQYWSTPYYPSLRNALYPAQTLGNKIPVVITQWAARDPVNGYGKGVEESTFSVQPNDYLDYHNLSTGYFSSLVDIYTNPLFGQFGHLVVGLENSYSWDKYGQEFEKEIEILVKKENSGQIRLVTMSQFAGWYKDNFPALSPEHIISANDPLGSGKKAVWFMNPYYRIGWFYENPGSIIRDIRQYVEGEEEICYRKACKELNFATLATRVLDDVTNGDRWVIDIGKIEDFKVEITKDNYMISYTNEASKDRTIRFLPRDIEVDNVISTIDGTILKAVGSQQPTIKTDTNEVNIGFSKIFSTHLIISLFLFLIFVITVLLIPGFILSQGVVESGPLAFRAFVSLVIGLVVFSLVCYFAGLINLPSIIFVYIIVMVFWFFKSLSWEEIKKMKLFGSDKLSFLAVGVIIAGSLFQWLSVTKSGIVTNAGIGFWGPNTHDGVWHIALINQLLQKVPPQNPIYAGENLRNYHYFYDLMVASTAYIIRVDVVDLIFRFYPLFFSLLLGAGTYYLVLRLYRNKLGENHLKLSAIFTLIFVYFAGSFGWIVEYLKYRHIGGESAFWANQSISFNLNPPFAVSLIILITLVHLLTVLDNRNESRKKIVLIILLGGSMVGFKAYGAILVLSSLLVIVLVKILKRDLRYLGIFIGMTFLNGIIFLINFGNQSIGIANSVFIWSPFWFIHTMIDSPDRVGWERLSLARVSSLEMKNWGKFVLAEGLGLLIFIIGNLGMRVIGIPAFLKSIRSIFKDTGMQFIVLVTIIAFLVPVLFIQSGNPWNVIQFMYYGLYFISIFAGIGLAGLYFKLPKVLGALVVLAVIALVPVNSFATASGYLTPVPHALISDSEVQALGFLSNQADGVVLVHPYDKALRGRFTEPLPLFAYDSTGYVSAYSKHATFLEDEPQNVILLTDYRKRLVASKDFFKNLNLGAEFPQGYEDAKDFLSKNNIKYIYLVKSFNTRVDGEKLNLKRIFDNETVSIYEVE